MDIVSLGVLFLLVMGGGASAWVADSLGWRIGKKRHSMFGMRPKHFARLVVTIAGALIPLVTIGILTGSSEGVRVWILRGREAAEQLPGVTRDLEGARRELVDVQRQEGDLRRQIGANRRELDDTQKLAKDQKTLINDQTDLLEDQKAKIADGVARIARLAADTRRLAAESRRSAAETRRLRLANNRVQSALKRTQSAYKQGQDALARIKSETALAKTDLARIKGESNDVNRENLRVTRLNIELTQSVGELRASIADLEGQIGRLRTAREDAERDSEAARAERDELRGDVARLERERRNAEELLRLYQNDSRQTRLQALTFRSGDELSRIVVPAGASVADVRATIESALRQARLEAERKGARPNPNATPPMRAADLVEGEINRKPISPTEQVDRLATALAGGSGDAVVVARSLWNIFGEEAVAVNLAAFPDPVVFRAGEVVAEGRLDSRRGDEAVYAQINEFLGTRVQERARAAKMVPLVVDGQESFGQIEPAQILSVIRTARAEERVYRLQAIVVGDIRAGDRLRVELRLR